MDNKQQTTIPPLVVRRIACAKSLTGQIRAAIRNWTWTDVPPRVRSKVSANQPLTIDELKRVANALLCSVNHLEVAK